MLGLQVTIPSFPGIGNTLPVAILFLLHVAVAEFTLGAITLAVAMEWRALRTGDARAQRYTWGAASVYYLMFSVGATLAVFAVVLLLGLWGNMFGRLANVMLPLFALAFGLFLVLTPLLVVYRNTFGKISPIRHAMLGTVVVLLQSLFVVLIVGVDAYLITPFHAGLAEAALNPPYVPLLVHRLIGNVSWTALVLAAYAAVKLRRAVTPEERLFQGWAARVNLRIGLITALLMPLEGFAMIMLFNTFQPGYYNELLGGPNAWLMVLQEAFVAVVYIGGNVALAAESRWTGEGTDRFALPAVGVSVVGMTLATLPSSVLPGSLEPLRFAGLGATMLVTAAHLAARRMGRAPASAPSADMRQPALRWGRRTLVTVGAFSLLTSLLMGVIKESARGTYAVYGELTQADAGKPFNPPGYLYP